MKNAVISLTFVVSLLVTCTATKAFETYVRRNVPQGYTMNEFVETCETCGVLYGKDCTYKCLADSSLNMFRLCTIAVYNKRR